MPCKPIPIEPFPPIRYSPHFERATPTGYEASEVSHRLNFSLEAEGDLLDLYEYIAQRDSNDRAIGCIDRIEACCRSLATFPERGTLRSDLRPGLRTPGLDHGLFHTEDLS